MSDASNNGAVPELSILDQLKQQHAAFITQRDQTQTNLNQLIGAIFACDMMIKKHEAEEAKTLSQESGVEEHGEAHNEESGQVA